MLNTTFPKSNIASFGFSMVLDMIVYQNMCDVLLKLSPSSTVSAPPNRLNPRLTVGGSKLDAFSLGFGCRDFPRLGM